VTLLARHPAPSSIVLAALAAIACVFLFARPEYHPPNQGGLVELDLSKYPAASGGWRWSDGQPGFRFGKDKEAWNISGVKPSELAPARAAAGSAGVDPRSIRFLDAIRLGSRDLSLIVAGTEARGDGTCLGFVTPSEAPAFYCGDALADASAFLLVTTRGPFNADGKTVQPTFLTGIASGDVTRIVVDQPLDWPNGRIYDRKQGSLWGTFELSLSDSRAVRVSVYGKNGVMARMPVDITKPGDLLLKIPG
jgi:hypothetical protein